ncbi:MAG: TetR/AcrR family transcriptional regulator [Methylomonas sp.]|jgi:AcrR family transcriptional regulator
MTIMPRNLRDHILKTASELFYSHGIKATGIDAIVKACGIAKMSLYKYFPAKEDLILAHLQNSAEEMRARISIVLDSGELTPQQKLLGVFDVFSQLLVSPGFRGCPFINASAEFADANHPVLQASAEFYASFSSVLINLAAQAGCKNAEELGHQLAMLIAGATVMEQMRKNSGAMRSAYAAAQILIAKDLEA